LLATLLLNLIFLLDSIQAQEAKRNFVAFYPDYGVLGRFSNRVISLTLYFQVAQMSNATMAIAKRAEFFSDYPNIMSNSISFEELTDSDEKLYPFKLACFPYFQNYLALKDLRGRTQFLLQPSAAVEKEIVDFGLQIEDVVIHFRFYEYDHPLLGGTMAQAFVPVDYFRRILQLRKQQQKQGRILIIGESHLHDNADVRILEQEFNATFLSGSLAFHFNLARNASTFIGTFGTFSWNVAYLSQGNKTIHLPYHADHVEGSSWTPHASLFIHDDHRIRYHNLAGPESFQTAEEVMATDSAFANGIRNRDGHCNPKGPMESWNGKAFRSHTSREVFYMDHNVLRSIPDMDTFYALHLNINEIILLSHEEIISIPHGPSMEKQGRLRRHLRSLLPSFIS